MKRSICQMMSMATCCGLSGMSMAQEKPNVLFILADDMSYETIGAAGLLDIDTPNLDRLAARGAMVSHAYNMGSYSPAVCHPSRTMLVTGRSVWHAQQIDNQPAMNAEVDEGHLWPQLMKQAGYQTFLSGKWHVRAPTAQVFDVVQHERYGMPEQTEAGYNRPKDEDGYKNGWKPWETKYGGFWEGGTHWTELAANDAIGFLNRASETNRPFFIYLAFNAAHDPHQSPKEYVDRYPLSRIKLPENFLPDYPYRQAIGCGKVLPRYNTPFPEGTSQEEVESGVVLRDEALAPFPRTEYAIKVNCQEYFAQVTHMDAHIGRVLDALEESGQADHTYIFFTADNGLACGHHGFMGKQNMYDHSMRVPLIVAGPGVPAGTTIDASVYLQDVMPSALDVAGVPRPDYVEFDSLLPLLRGATGREALYGVYMDRQRMVQKDGWKLIQYPTIGVERLFHVAADPLEMRDLAGNPEAAPKLKALRAELKSISDKLNDPLMTNRSEK
jgi:choline-sulfatase